MIQRTVKRSLFFVGIILTGISGTVSSYFHTNYSKENSLFIDSVHADVSTAWVTGETGCGGCSGGDSGGGGSG